MLGMQRCLEEQGGLGKIVWSPPLALKTNKGSLSSWIQKCNLSELSGSISQGLKKAKVYKTHMPIYLVYTPKYVYSECQYSEHVHLLK